MTSVNPKGNELLIEALDKDSEVSMEQGAPPPELPKIFHAIDRFVTIMRVYPLGHPLTHQFAEQLVEQMHAFLQHERLLFQLRPHALVTARGEVFFSKEDSEREHFLWYGLAADGMFELEFLEDISAEDLIAFFDVVNIASLGNMPLDDDTITLLWERDLKGMRYSTMEGRMGGVELENFEHMTEPEARALVMSAVIEPDSEQGKKLTTLFDDAPRVQADVFTRMQLEGSSMEQLARIPDQVFADAFRVDTAWEHQLVQEWITGNRLEYRLIEVLLSIVRTAPESEHGARALQTIFDITTQLLEQHHYDLAITILELLKARSSIFEGSDIDPMDGVLAYLSDPMRIEAFLFQAQQRPHDREHIIHVLKMVGPTKVQMHILKMLVRDDSSAIREPHVLLGILLAVTTRENERNLIHDNFAKNPNYLTTMLDFLTLEHITQHPILPRLMSRAVESQETSIRIMALNLVDACWCTPLVIDNYIIPLMSEGDEDVRRLAIQTVRELSPPDFERWLTEVMNFDKLVFRPAGEIRFLLGLVLEKGDEHVESLRGLLKTRGWFSAHQRNLARSVARLLLERQDAPARDIIRALASSLLTSPALRKDYAQLLARHDSAASEPPHPDASPQDPQGET